MENNIFSKQWWSKTLNLHESPPNNFEDDDNHQYVEDNLSSINKAALAFNFPVDDMQLVFNGASSLVLMDDVWSKIENSNSYNIQSLGQALLYAKEHKIDPVPYLEAIKNMEPLPQPLVLRYDTDKYYLVNGEFVLSLQKALNMTPDVLQGTINVKIKEDGSQENEINLVNEFISYVKDNLGLVQTPKIDFSDDIDHVKEQCSFGYFSPDANIIWVYAGDRNMADVFRTLAHELVHRKQEEDGKINYESGKTGSDIENEANAKAGILLRDFGKKHNGIYDTPIKKFIKGSINEVKIQSSVPNNLAKLEQIKDEMSQTKDEATLKALSIKAVELVFPIWHYYYSNDKRVKNSIEAAKRGEIDDGGANEAGGDIVNNNTPGAYDVARAAAYAASDVHGNPEAAAYVTIHNAIEATKKYFKISEVKIQPPLIYKKAYGEVHSYNEMKKWQEQNNTLPSHFLVDRTNNTVLAGFQDYNIPKWAWNLHGNENAPAEGNNIFALASKSSITNPPPYLNNPNIDVTNPNSWSNISKVKQYIKNSVNEVKIQKPLNFPFLKLKKGQKIKFETKDFSFIGDIVDIKFVKYKPEFDDDGRILSADREIKPDFGSSEAMIIYVKRDLQSFKIKPGAPSYIKVPEDEMVSYMFTNPENNPDNADNIKANNLYLWDKFTILNEVKIQNFVVNLDQKIKDISNDINDQIEHIYFIGDDTNDLNDQMDNIARMYNWDYTTESLKNMNVKNDRYSRDNSGPSKDDYMKYGWLFGKR
jgi:Zn-dependent peptidase ImmA (M78 family)